MTCFSINDESKKKSQWKLENIFTNRREMEVQHIKISEIYLKEYSVEILFY